MPGGGPTQERRLSSCGLRMLGLRGICFGRKHPWPIEVPTQRAPGTLIVALACRFWSSGLSDGGLHRLVSTYRTVALSHRFQNLNLSAVGLPRLPFVCLILLLAQRFCNPGLFHHRLFRSRSQFSSDVPDHTASLAKLAICLLIPNDIHTLGSVSKPQHLGYSRPKSWD